MLFITSPSNIPRNLDFTGALHLLALRVCTLRVRTQTFDPRNVGKLQLIFEIWGNVRSFAVHNKNSVSNAVFNIIFVISTPNYPSILLIPCFIDNLKFVYFVVAKITIFITYCLQHFIQNQLTWLPTIITVWTAFLGWSWNFVNFAYYISISTTFNLHMTNSRV